ncbi:trypsin-like [Tenebrio molitor]|uniref:trypsin-like n=1 Tax=Tenebrio molitor TaxID=7067 RepID=UPI0036247949
MVSEKNHTSSTITRNMLLLSYITFFVGLIVGEIKAQTGGTTAAGDSYVCVPPGYCDNGGTPTSPGIDPRIVTPGELCPAGTIPCYTQGPSSRCGERFVTPTSTADGPTSAEAHPWQAFIRNSTHPVYAGSGVLIDNYHILTAAHKVALETNAASVSVIMGVTDPNNLADTQIRTAATIVVHPNYNPATLQNDIAIIRVSSPFSLSQNNINSGCLPAANSGATYVGQTCVVAGWGETQFTQNDQPTNPMKQVNVGVVDYATCRAGLVPVLSTSVDTYLDATGGETCAGGEAMKDACTYDGGAPLTCPNTGKGSIAGLVIWGKSCGQPSVYGVYVSVPYYRGWIDTTISSLNNS